jgi:hypothetical protein
MHMHLTISNQKMFIQISRFALPFYFRGGRGGGYKELDEEELEEVKKRRKEAEEVGCLLKLLFFVYVVAICFHV